MEQVRLTAALWSVLSSPRMAAGGGAARFPAHGALVQRHLADMYKTVFDLIISVKLFLGRFDMRTMQVGPPVTAAWCWQLAPHCAGLQQLCCRIEDNSAVRQA